MFTGDVNRESRVALVGMLCREQERCPLVCCLPAQGQLDVSSDALQFPAGGHTLSLNLNFGLTPAASPKCLSVYQRASETALETKNG